MIWRLAMSVAGAVLILAAFVLVLRLIGLTRPPAVPQPSLQTVWCVKRGYPADLAIPVITGPGTGLAGCPLGEVQVREP